jgi:hypothetical protein
MKSSILIVIAILVSGLAYGQTAEPYFYSAISKEELEEYRGDIADYSKAIELNPYDALAYINRGFAKSEFEDYSVYSHFILSPLI